MSGMYDTTASVFTKTLTKNDAGGFAETWTLLGTIRCKLWLRTDVIKEIGGVSDSAEMVYNCCCPVAGVAIGESDELRVGTTKYAVNGVHIVAGHHRKFTLIEYRPE